MKKDKNKQIKEMSNLINKTLFEYLDKENLSCKDVCDLLAKDLLEHYQPKLLEDSVVLTREEWAKRMSMAKRNHYLKKRVEKETTRKVIMDFYYELFEAPNGRVITYGSFCKIAQKHNIEIPRETFTLAELEAKREDVEIKEN